MRVEGSTAVVTGANRGIGEAYVQALVDRGASKVYAGARDPSALEQVASESGGRIVPMELDVTVVDHVAAAAQVAGDATLLINNAGISHYGVTVLDDEAVDLMRREFEVNVLGVMHMCRAFAPVLGAHGGGCIVNVLSASALQQNPMVGTYSATKAAALSLTRTFRSTLRAQQTLVVAAIVGATDTRLAADVPSTVVKSPPILVANNTLDAVERGDEDVDTDPSAIATRARVARDPKAAERFHEWRLNLPRPPEAQT